MINEEQLNENIISALGIGALPDDQKIAMLKKMSELVQKRIALKILQKLKVEDKEKFVEAMDANKGDDIQEILERYNIDILSLIEEEANNLKQELKSQVVDLGV